MPADLLAPQIAALDMAQFMRAALYEAKQAGLAGELPIGAVLVIDRQIVSRGRAQHQAKQSQLMHAELNALLNAGLPLWEHYHNALLFTTVEPCPMCLGAVVMADVPHIIQKLNPAQYQPSDGAQYPDSPYGKALMQIAQLIKADLGLQIACADIGDWDTHVNEGGAEARWQPTSRSSATACARSTPISAPHSAG